MAQWWELAIPAGSAIVAGWSGAWLQARAAARNLRTQLDDAAAIRAETTERERLQRNREERQSAYVKLINLFVTLEQTRAYRKHVTTQLRSVEKTLKDPALNLSDEERSSLLNIGTQLSSEQSDALSKRQVTFGEFVDTITFISIVSSQPVIAAANEILAAHLNSDNQRASGETKVGSTNEVVAKFRKAAREELEIDGASIALPPPHQ